MEEKWVMFVTHGYSSHWKMLVELTMPKRAVFVVAIAVIRRCSSKKTNKTKPSGVSYHLSQRPPRSARCCGIALPGLTSSRSMLGSREQSADGLGDGVDLDDVEGSHLRWLWRFWIYRWLLFEDGLEGAYGRWLLLEGGFKGYACRLTCLYGGPSGDPWGGARVVDLSGYLSRMYRKDPIGGKETLTESVAHRAKHGQ